MTGAAKGRGRMTAAELMAQLEHDPEWVRARDERQAELDRRTAVLREAERPIVADLAVVGVEVSSVWDLVNTSVPYPAALPVLFDHLQRGGYPTEVMESLARALAVRPAAPYWYRFRDLYRAAPNKTERGGLAVASASASAETWDDLVALAMDSSLDSSRILLLGRIKAIHRVRGTELMQSLVDDPVLGKEARHLLPRKRKTTPKDGRRLMSADFPHNDQSTDVSVDKIYARHARSTRTALK